MADLELVDEWIQPVASNSLVRQMQPICASALGHIVLSDFPSDTVSRNVVRKAVRNY